MRIIVTLKQAPKSNRVEMNDNNNTVIRDPEEAMLTFDDCNALEMALRMKDAMGEKIHITTVSMGNKRSEEILRESLALGVDEAILVSDEGINGSDTIITSKLLAAIIKKIGNYDVVLMGNSTMDGRTGHTGPMVAEQLGHPFLTNVSAFAKEDGKLKVVRDLGPTLETVEAPISTVLANVKQRYSLRVMSIQGIRKAMTMDIPVWALDDLGMDPDDVGLIPSKTRVESIEKITKNRLKRQIFFNKYEDGDFNEIIKEIQKIN